jgi:hypothetical protein
MNRFISMPLTIYLPIFLLVFWPVGIRALDFNRLEPLFAEVGESVTLFGEDIMTTGTYSVTVAGTDANAEEVQADYIRFTIPAGSATGSVIVETDEGTTTHSRSLIVTRLITATINTTIDLSNYPIGTIYGEGDWGPGGNTLDVAIGQTTLVSTFRSDDDPGFMAYVTNSSNAIELNTRKPSQFSS